MVAVEPIAAVDQSHGRRCPEVRRNVRDYRGGNILDGQEATDRLKAFELAEQCDLRRARASERGGPLAFVVGRREQRPQLRRGQGRGQFRVYQSRDIGCADHGDLDEAFRLAGAEPRGAECFAQW